MVSQSFRIIKSCAKLCHVKKIAFTKMHGLGNDFIVVNAVSQPFSLSSEDIQRMADRRLGVGCDQLLVLEPPRNTSSDFFYRIFNADGSEVGQCGNGARCMALFIKEERLSPKTEWVLQTSEVSLRCRVVSSQQVAVLFPTPLFENEAIPYLPNHPASFQEEFFVVNVGNPHAIVIVDSVESVDLYAWGQLIKKDLRFPEGVNLSVMTVVNKERIHLRVFERGAGETLACGSAAIAAVAAGRRAGLLGPNVRVTQPGGELEVLWQDLDSCIEMRGPASRVYVGDYFLR